MEKKTVVNGKVKVKVCQDCKSHKNNPSFCKDKGEYVGRKHKDCKKFTRK